MSHECSGKFGKVLTGARSFRSEYFTSCHSYTFYRADLVTTRVGKFISHKNFEKVGCLGQFPTPQGSRRRITSIMWDMIFSATAA